MSECGANGRFSIVALTRLRVMRSDIELQSVLRYRAFNFALRKRGSPYSRVRPQMVTMPKCCTEATTTATATTLALTHGATAANPHRPPPRADAAATNAEIAPGRAT